MTFARALLVATLALMPLGAAAQNTGPHIVVTGEGRVAVAPDMARISLGVTHQADTAAAAVAQMSADMARVLEELAAAGIAPADIQTGVLQVSPQQDYNSASGNPRILGYLATTEVNVRVAELDKLGEVLDAVVQDGANQMNGLMFDVADRAPHLLAARQAAVADARAKAQVFADAAGVGLGSLISLSEGGASIGPMMLREQAFDTASAIPVAAGEVTIDAHVTMVYAIGE